MKKELTFALACASTFALFAVDITPKADFELYDVDAPVAGIPDPNGALHWIYMGASGSEDGSKVQAYEQTTQYGSKYLSLSTEGVRRREPRRAGGGRPELPGALDRGRHAVAFALV